VPLLPSAPSKCPSEEALSLFAEGTLAKLALAEFEEHLDRCGNCRELLHAMRGDRKTGSRGWLARDTMGTIAPGTVVAGRYRITRLIGRGGMGEVYEAEDLMLHTVVGLKSLTVREMKQEDSQRRLRREVLMARQVTHPNVCRIFDFGATSDLCFLTMEYLPGTTLRKYLVKKGRLDEDAARPFVFQITAGLQAAHNAGVIHRDLKSENVLLVDSDRGPPRAVITDFGLAKTTSPGGPLSTIGGQFAGTLTHAAPEQLRGHRSTPLTDIYALGVILFELITGGKLPLAGSTPFEIAHARLSQPAPTPRSLGIVVSPVWAHAIAACLEREPGGRPPRASDVFKTLYPS